LLVLSGTTDQEKSEVGIQNAHEVRLDVNKGSSIQAVQPPHSKPVTFYAEKLNHVKPYGIGAIVTSSGKGTMNLWAVWRLRLEPVPLSQMKPGEQDYMGAAFKVFEGWKKIFIQDCLPFNPCRSTLSRALAVPLEWSEKFANGPDSEIISFHGFLSFKRNYQVCDLIS